MSKSNKSSVWDPFEPTIRDIERTEELASQSAFLAGLLTFVFLPLGMIYLNRGINSLKILGYGFAIAFLIAILSFNKPEEESTAIGESIGVIGSIATIVENSRAVTLARKRQAEKDS